MINHDLSSISKLSAEDGRVEELIEIFDQLINVSRNLRSAPTPEIVNQEITKASPAVATDGEAIAHETPVISYKKDHHEPN